MIAGEQYQKFHYSLQLILFESDWKNNKYCGYNPKSHSMAFWSNPIVQSTLNTPVQVYHIFLPLDEAYMIVADKRFQPIILTTTTTVIGLIPLVLTGGELFQPLAISLMFGLTVSMVLTLVIFPVTFSVVEDKRNTNTPTQTI